MIVTNRVRGTWTTFVDAFIALSEHARQKYVAAGLPADRIFVKPNFVQDPGESRVLPSHSNRVVSAGRLSAEKGVWHLLLGWQRAGLSRIGRLVIAGDGPLRPLLEKEAADLGLSAPAVVFTGRIPTMEVLKLLQSARALVLPSLFFENFPRVLVEAFASGRPAITSKLGALEEIMASSHAGLTYLPPDIDALGAAVTTILRDGHLADRLGQQAREAYLAKYSPQQNFASLMEIYRTVIEHHAKRGCAASAVLPCQPVPGD